MISNNEADGLPRAGRANASVFDRILYWNPDFSEVAGSRARSSMGLTIGYIGSPELYRDLTYEVDIHILTPNNYREVLLYGDIDFLLFESAWDCLVPAWYQSHRPESPSHAILQSALDVARQSHCPSVLWLTKGETYADEYVGQARVFDHVFAADASSVRRLQSQGVPSSLLKPWVQPELYSPFYQLNTAEDASFPVYFDGWADVERNPSSFGVLEELADKYELGIFESRYRVPAARAHTVASLTPTIKGVLTETTHPLALRGAQTALSFTHTLSSFPMQHQRALQAAASKALPVHVGRLQEGDPRHGLVCAVDDGQALLDLLGELENAPRERARLQHRAWREAVKHGTLRHRLRTICQILEIDCHWAEWPLVSVVAPTCRPENVPTLIENFDRQAYAYKELVVVINGDSSAADRLRAEYGARTDIVWDSVPADRFTGSALNRANLRARADLAIKMDDDDIYGAHYVEDIVLSLRCFSADVFGKVPAPMLFEGEQTAYQRRQRFGSHVIATGEDLAARRLWLGGNTVGWRRSAFPAQLFADDLIGAVDSIFNENLPSDTPVLVLDPFNVVTVRKEDPEQHTWRHDKDRLKTNSEMVGTVDDWLP